MSHRELKDIVKTLESTRVETKQAAFLGNLHTGELRVENSNKFYATLFNGQVVKVVNNKVPSTFGWSIYIGRNTGSFVSQVLGTREVYPDSSIPDIPEHSKTQEWGQGYDTLWVRSEQIKYLLAMPHDDTPLGVRFYGGDYRIEGLYYVIDNQELIDLTGEVPVSGAEWVNVEVDTSQNITFNHGVNKASWALLEKADIPNTEIDKYMLFSVILYTGQPRILKNLFVNHIFDPKFTRGGGTASLSWDSVLEKPTWINALESGQLLEYIEIDRWSALENDDTFDFTDLVKDVISIEVNGVTQDPLTYNLSSDGLQVVLDTPLAFDAIVTSKYKVEVL